MATARPKARAMFPAAEATRARIEIAVLGRIFSHLGQQIEHGCICRLRHEPSLVVQLAL
jgi:hypothetical protein